MLTITISSSMVADYVSILTVVDFVCISGEVVSNNRIGLAVGLSVGLTALVTATVTLMIFCFIR